MTEFALRNTRVTVGILIALACGGVLSYLSMPRAEDPGFTIRHASVTTFFPGASPERVEQLVTDKIEKAVQEMSELESVSSVSRAGVSSVHIEIKGNYFDLRPVWDHLRRKVEKVRAELPEDIIGPVVDDNFGDVFGIVFAFTAEGFSYREMKAIAEDIRDELLMLEDTSKVLIYGEQEERIFVEFKNERLAELNLSPLHLRSALNALNVISPAGTLETGEVRLALEPTGNFNTVEDVKRTLLRVPGESALLQLGDVAEVRRGYAQPPSAKMHYSGHPSIGIAVSMREGGNIMRLGKRVRELMAEWQATYPLGIEFGTLSFQPDNVQKRIGEFQRSIILSILIIGVVMLSFLGIRTGLVVVCLIPMTILMSMVIMPFLGIGLNSMSLAALIISLGMLVDNAIVISESILVQMAEGKKPAAAAIDSGKELRLPLLVASASTAAAFLPIYLAESSAGEYTAPIFIVVTVTLVSSWFLALTMIPLLCTRFGKVDTSQKGDPYKKRIYVIYGAVLVYVLKHRYATLCLVAVSFLITLQGLRWVPNMFFPPSERTTFLTELEFSDGTPIERVEEIVYDLESYMRDELTVGKYPKPGLGITNWAAYIGEGGPRFVLTFFATGSRSQYAMIVTNTNDYHENHEYMKRIYEYCTDQYPGVSTTIRAVALGPPTGKQVQIRVLGEDPEVIFRIVDRIKDKLESPDLSGPRNVQDNWGAKGKKIIVKIDEERTRRAGLSNRDVAIALQSVISGFTVARYREAEGIIPVTMRSVAPGRHDFTKLETLNVYSNLTGESVPLLQVADLELTWQPVSIQRRERKKTVTISADLLPGYTAYEVNQELIPWLKEESRSWPFGYSYEIGGTTEESNKSNDSIMVKLPMAGFLILLLLIGEFNSFRKTLITILTVPLAFMGVIIGLLVMQSYFGFMTLLGVVSLTGIVINNAIVLLERIQFEIDENGLPQNRAVVEAARRRFRPILLTTASTIGGMAPLLFGGGPMWTPMAIAIMFGLAFSTILTLGVVPVLYALFFRVDYRNFAL